MPALHLILKFNTNVHIVITRNNNQKLKCNNERPTLTI